MNDIYPSSPINDIPINCASSIYDQLCQLDISKSPGPDGWHPRFLLAIPLQILFRKFLDSGFIPKQWKTANVTPSYIYKRQSQITIKLQANKSNFCHLQSF